MYNSLINLLSSTSEFFENLFILKLDICMNLHFANHRCVLKYILCNCTFLSIYFDTFINGHMGQMLQLKYMYSEKNSVQTET